MTRAWLFCVLEDVESAGTMVEMDLLVFLLILSVLVVIHELGHYFAALLFGIRVEEFGFGLPPKVMKLFRHKDTDFTLNLLPIGGFVKLAGEEYSDGPVRTDMFYQKPIWQRAVVLTAGVVMNFLLGVLLFAGVYSYLGVPEKTDRVKIEEVTKNSPAEMAGIKIEERVMQFSVLSSQFSITDGDQLVKLIGENKGKEVTLTVQNTKGESREVKVTPRLNPPAGEGSLGVLLNSVELVKYPWWQMPFRGSVVGLKEAIAWGREILDGLAKTVGTLFKGKVPDDVSGPVGIYQVSSKVTKHGLIAILQFMGVLSINLAILNIMPLPALDGGRVVFLAVEKVIGKKWKNKIEGSVHSIGMIVLLGLMLAITIRDVVKLFGKVN